jgi:hypothetical protein
MAPGGCGDVVEPVGSLVDRPPHQVERVEQQEVFDEISHSIQRRTKFGGEVPNGAS